MLKSVLKNVLSLKTATTLPLNSLLLSLLEEHQESFVKVENDEDEDWSMSNI